MRSTGRIWHPRLIEVIASLGHGDALVLADAGFPVGGGVETIDLVWTRGEPALLPVLAAVLEELRVESAVVASELDGTMRTAIDQALQAVPVARIAHDELKQAATAARAVVRTGETTSYANVLLRAGVVF